MSHGPTTKHFKVELRMDTLAFHGSEKGGELSRILKRLSDDVRKVGALTIRDPGMQSVSRTIFDKAGNDIGRWTVALEE